MGVKLVASLERMVFHFDKFLLSAFRHFSAAFLASTVTICSLYCSSKVILYFNYF